MGDARLCIGVQMIADSFAKQIQIGSITINSLPPTSRQPLIVRPFQPAASFTQSLPLLHNVKGKTAEATSDLDYALLEGLVVAATVCALAFSRHRAFTVMTDEQYLLPDFGRKTARTKISRRGLSSGHSDYQFLGRGHFRRTWTADIMHLARSIL